MNCWVIDHGQEVICKVEHTIDQQTMIYYSTIHALELIYFNSNTQETMKKQLYASVSSNFPPLHWRIQQIFLSVTAAYMYFVHLVCAKMTFHSLTSRKDGQWEGWRHKTATISVSQFRPVICCRIRHESVQLAKRCFRLVTTKLYNPLISNY